MDVGRVHAGVLRLHLCACEYRRIQIRKILACARRMCAYALHICAYAYSLTMKRHRMRAHILFQNPRRARAHFV